MQSQKGFGTIEAIIVIVVVALLGVGGWFVWHNNRKDPVKTTVQKVQKSDDKKQEKTKDDQRYMVIEEWGVKMPLDETIAGAYYEMEPVTGDVQYASVFDAGFDALKNANGTSCGGANTFQIYSIGRAKAEAAAGLMDPESPTFEGPGPTYRAFPFTTDYHFGGLAAHQAAPPCSILNLGSGEEVQLDEDILAAFEARRQAFGTAFKGLQAD